MSYPELKKQQLLKQLAEAAEVEEMQKLKREKWMQIRAQKNAKACQEKVAGVVPVKMLQLILFAGMVLGSFQGKMFPYSGKLCANMIGGCRSASKVSPSRQIFK